MEDELSVEGKYLENIYSLATGKSFVNKDNQDFLEVLNSKIREFTNIEEIQRKLFGSYMLPMILFTVVRIFTTGKNWISDGLNLKTSRELIFFLAYLYACITAVRVDMSASLEKQESVIWITKQLFIWTVVLTIGDAYFLFADIRNGSLGEDEGSYYEDDENKVPVMECVQIFAEKYYIGIIGFCILIYKFRKLVQESHIMLRVLKIRNEVYKELLEMNPQ